MDINVNKNRLIYMDILRIIACFSVVMLHTAAQFWYTLPIDQLEWKIANSYDAVFRFGVPIFVMISGALFLNKEKVIIIKKLYRHNILRLAIVYIIWSCIYGLIDSRYFVLEQVGIKPVIKEMIYGRYHLWYLPMIIGIYMILPILKEWINHASKKMIEYFLILFLICQILFSTATALYTSPVFKDVLGLINVPLVCSYVGYFVLGYYLIEYGIPNWTRRLLYPAAMISILLNVLLGNSLALKAGEATGEIYDSFGVFTFIIVIAIFQFAYKFLNPTNLSKNNIRIINEVSKATLGIYVMHIAIIELLEPIGIHSMMMPIGIGIPIFAALVFVLGYFMAALLRRMPIIGKYIC